MADDLLSQIRLNGAVPRHVAVIMDGNGRWARERSLPRPLGHRAGMKAVREAVEGALEAGVEVLTLFAFSEENREHDGAHVSPPGPHLRPSAPQRGTRTRRGDAAPSEPGPLRGAR